MPGKRLTSTFYKRPATELAPELLGKLICRRINGKINRFRIIETECYYGEEDTACHAHHGKTERTKIMYERGGLAYVYLCYGIHSLLNIVTGPKGFPEAVLIRGVEEVQKTGNVIIYNGPGRVTKAMSVDCTFNYENLITSKQLWLEDDGYKPEYILDKRIGINYADREDIDRLWRYIKT
ncbi:MAG: DNA-3-methyladenine glycosylase [Eubacterium sp.]